MSKKRHRDIPIEVEEKPTKQEYAIAKYLKNNTPTKKTKFLSHQVNYFYANKLIDAALDSPWATGKDVVFTDRQSVVDYCDRFLKFKFFHRAKKIAITDKDLKPKDLKKKKLKEKEEKKKEKEKEKEREKEKKALEIKKEEKEKEEQKEKEEKESKEDENIEDEEDGDKNEEDTDKNQETEEKQVAKKEKKKKKTKIKLDMHLEQIFVDGTDAYVWMYDPIPFWYYIVGGLCLFGAIAVCLFPLWPPEVRKGVYYLSVAAAGFLGVILGLAVVRFIVFCIVWTLTMGRHHLWLLPNLTEDVGFFQSFWPLYHYEYRGDDYKGKKKRKKKSKEEKEEEEDEEEKDEDKKSEWEDQGAIDSPDTAAETDKPETDGERGGTEATGISESESENSNSQAFEIVDKEDLVEAQEAEKDKDKDKEEQADIDNEETVSQENKKEEKVEE